MNADHLFISKENCQPTDIKCTFCRQGRLDGKHHLLKIDGFWVFDNGQAQKENMDHNILYACSGCELEKGFVCKGIVWFVRNHHPRNFHVLDVGKISLNQKK